MEIKVMADILEVNDTIAAKVNARLTEKGIFVLNLLGSPGCGKTSLLERTIAALKDKISIAVIEGDLFTDKDAVRIERHGVPVVQVNTVGGCHLDANMIERVLQEFSIESIDLLIIENVGNLVCPAEFNIGEHARATVLSIAEGDDKPLKYPLIFKEADVIILNKIDLLPYTDFNYESAMRDLQGINPSASIITASCRTNEGLPLWYDWLLGQTKNRRGG